MHQHHWPVPGLSRPVLRPHILHPLRLVPDQQGEHCSILVWDPGQGSLVGKLTLHTISQCLLIEL